MHSYNHMKREHYNGRLPIATRPKPSFVQTDVLPKLQPKPQPKTPQPLTADALAQSLPPSPGPAEGSLLTPSSKLDSLRSYASYSWKWLTTGESEHYIMVIILTSPTDLTVPNYTLCDV